jgi:UDP-N-acetylglucosamine 1-carboxyvinyltransferase
MGSFEVVGGKKLKGTITPQGAKNETLQIISAVLLTNEKVIVHNIPDIIDVNLQIQLLHDLGVKIEKKDAHTYSFQADDVNIDFLSSDEFKNPINSITA